ncbi:helix-turn-helix transcriptional regulator [Paenibacillus sacheonensis]|uniref:helix-turn-helix transcriptional regulator n=1 Tax=Paenibacillus sacheonensis TaxID=742054 RepID=UPI001EF8BA19|nr:AraC family transcriptional regulator [Paenibacillus sacheonensis]MBM7565104.1 AraC-like DNA-binding protein [Paenibacillus sacheonensis]
MDCLDCLELRIPPLPQLLMIGHGLWPKGMQHFKRSFSVYDMLYVTGGRFYMTEDDTAYELERGDLLILEPGRTHFGQRPVTEPTELYWVHFSHPHPPVAKEREAIKWSTLLGKGTDKDLTPVDQYMYLPKHAHLDPALLVPLLDEMTELHETLTLRNSLRLNVLSGELFERLQATISGGLNSRSYHISERAVQYLKTHMTEPFDAEAMAAALHYNFDYLSRCLKQHTGMSPLQYVHHLQINRAVTLLLTTDLSVQEIGEQAGQPNGNYFIRLFRKHMGASPGAYRSMHRART